MKEFNGRGPLYHEIFDTLLALVDNQPDLLLNRGIHFLLLLFFFNIMRLMQQSQMYLYCQRFLSSMDSLSWNKEMLCLFTRVVRFMKE